MSEGSADIPSIEKMQPVGSEHGLAQQHVLNEVGQEMGEKQGVVGLARYLREIAGKPRGVGGGGKDLNSHFEEFIVEEDGEIKVTGLDDLQHKLAEQGASVQLLGVESIGSKNQKVSAVVQGVNAENPQSGYERPVVAEGPHMILAPYATDPEGNLHLFRTIQYRTGEAVIDTPRGFADAAALESGEQMYDVEGSAPRVQSNMQRVLGEEGGKKLLDIKRIVYLGAPRVNSSFVTSKSALFGVEVDYDNFVKSSKVIDQEELQRRKAQEDHEGLTGAVLDMTVDEYANYKRDSEIFRDMAADSGSDTVVIDWLTNKLQASQEVLSERRRSFVRVSKILQELKGEVDPEVYKSAVKKVMQDERGLSSEEPHDMQE